MSKSKTAVLDKSSCDRSPFCPVMRVCPVKAVTMASPSKNGRMGGFFGFGGGEVTIDQEKCTGCGKCVAHCPMGAVRMVGIDKPDTTSARQSVS